MVRPDHGDGGLQRVLGHAEAADREPCSRGRDGQGRKLRVGPDDGGDAATERVARDDDLITILHALLLEPARPVQDGGPDRRATDPLVDDRVAEQVADGLVREEMDQWHKPAHHLQHGHGAPHVYVSKDVVRRERTADHKDLQLRLREGDHAPAADGVEVLLDILELHVLEVCPGEVTSQLLLHLLLVLGVDGLGNGREIHRSQAVLLLHVWVAPVHHAERIHALLVSLQELVV
mmetsp:Transcript_56692/g.145918  ORF Transcript_56692/g.145918 Transcript_56692/m.145918 type:complete len:234 (+) Transcript_56692:228-929(+)